MRFHTHDFFQMVADLHGSIMQVNEGTDSDSQF